MEDQTTMVEKIQRTTVPSNNVIKTELNRGNLLGEGLLLSEKSQI